MDYPDQNPEITAWDPCDDQGHTNTVPCHATINILNRKPFQQAQLWLSLTTALGRWRQESQEFKTSHAYIAPSWPVWTIWDPVSRKPKPKITEKKFHRPVWAKDEDLASCYVNSVPSQCQAQLIWSRRVGSWERKEWECSSRVSGLSELGRFWEGNLGFPMGTSLELSTYYFLLSCSQMTTKAKNSAFLKKVSWEEARGNLLSSQLGMVSWKGWRRSHLIHSFLI